MEGAMIKFTKQYFADNNELEHYRDIAMSAITDISSNNIEVQLEEEVIKIATSKLDRKKHEQNLRLPPATMKMNQSRRIKTQKKVKMNKRVRA